ncbi:hypothetical protein TNIN_22841 [Trichonephila inaurata madagascariensis]|uniref:Uncharacterized protein n=1 Tax=Trichonephila inaurata madagascariensis TaxID=2747483 RepID=A0A8X6I5Z3_9ARAC|nr:hypothetical protein TNIN_22841 [Trichonephila inaurata madagascariensis]
MRAIWDKTSSGIASIKTDVGFVSKGTTYTFPNHAQSLYLDFCQLEILPAQWLENVSCTTYAASFLLFEESVLILTEVTQIPLIQKNPRGNHPSKNAEAEPLKPMESYFPHLKRVAAKPWLSSTECLLLRKCVCV